MVINMSNSSVLLLSKFYAHFQSCDIDLDMEISDVTQSEPFLLATGIPGTESCQVFNLL